MDLLRKVTRSIHITQFFRGTEICLFYFSFQCSPKEPGSSSHHSKIYAARVAEFLSLSYPTPIIVTPSLSCRSNSCGSLLLWQRGESEVWLDNTELREQSLGLLVLDAGMDNNIVTRNPVDGGGDTVLIASLKGVDDAEDLGSVTASGGRV